MVHSAGIYRRVWDLRQLGCDRVTTDLPRLHGLRGTDLDLAVSPPEADAQCPAEPADQRDGPAVVARPAAAGAATMATPAGTRHAGRSGVTDVPADDARES